MIPSSRLQAYAVAHLPDSHVLPHLEKSLNIHHDVLLQRVIKASISGQAPHSNWVDSKGPPKSMHFDQTSPVG